MTRQSYGSGDTNYIDFEYDSLDRIVKKSYNGNDSSSISYMYDPNGNLYRTEDKLWNMGTVYEYDLAGRINGITSRDRETNKMQAYESIRYNDGKGTIKSKIYNIYNADGQLLRQTPYSFTYGDPSKGEIPDTLYKLETGGGSYSYAYDSLARLESRTLTLGDTVKTESYTYAANPANSAFTTSLVSSMTDLAGKTHTYTYDANGNILTDTVDGQTVQYEYDSFNRLTGYYDPIANRTEFYTYDDRGNITERKYRNSYVSPEEVAENGTSGFTVTPYEYGDGTWADLLTKYGNTAIAYDEIGNPLNGKASYMPYTWDKGRNLVQYNFRSYSTSYTYNADGLRTSKTYYQSSSISKSTEYFIVDGRYVGEISTVGNIDYVIAYVYDENGSPAGINVNGTQYWFVKNLQGDVTAILDSNGAVVAVYTYSAWGVNVSVKDADGNRIDLKSHVAHLNPFRYRGYMYDEETGYYYLRSRYYNPEMGRFLNADGYVSTGVGLDGYNMFAYCNNSPVMYCDKTGRFPVLAAIGIAVCLVGVLLIPSDVDQTSNYQKTASEKYNKETVNVYFEGEGEPKNDMLNAKVYVADKDKNYLNISIDKSLDVDNKYEMNAVLDVIIDSEYYSEDLFGTKDFMRAQWIAHNMAYDIASSSDFGFSLMQFLGGTVDPLNSSSTLDIRQKENMLKRQRYEYTIISWFS